MMKILHIIANLASRYGGPPKACFEMTRAMANLGHAVSIYTTNQDGPYELDVPTDCSVFKVGVEVRYFAIQHPRFWGFSIPLARALRKAIREVDIVHIHSLYLFHGTVTAHYCRKYNVPYLIQPHGALDPFIYKRHRFRKSVMEFLFERRNIKHAAAIHFTTEEEKSLAATYTFQTPGVVVPLGLELSEYEKLPERVTFRAQYPETNGKKIILFFGRLNFKKGLDILVHAFAQVALERDDVHLVIAGPDNEGFGDKVRAWLNEEAVLDRATFTGMLTGEDKLAVLRHADIFVLPSYSENFGISVIEAMACGVPVVISDRVNIWHEVEANGAGRVGPCDADRFAEIISDLLDNPESAKQMGVKGKALVKERFQWPSVALAMEAAYRTILLRANPDN
ncbi:MAG: glycosyltransferase [Desulfobacterales bacterium]|nr:glycosyltransferase [Desulfobacterales bacterium]